MKNHIDFDSVLSLIDKAINPTYLSPTQEIVLREVWNGKTYSEMACDYNYDPEYIKGVGCNLWQTLSRAFNKQINKSNFVPFMRQKITQLLEEQEIVVEKQPQSLIERSKKQKTFYWTTAPNTNHFIGRQKETALVENWIQEPDCRCVIVSGMVGCGKTIFVTQFARKVQHQFDSVIWFSLLQTPCLKTLLNRYLKLIDPEYPQESKPEFLDVNFLLTRFIDCLRQKKILLIIDDLQSILQISQNNISYKEQFEEYGQLLRSLISTHHQSTLIATSRLKPKLLEYYSRNQVKFLDLQGFKQTTAKTFFQSQGYQEEEKILGLSEILQGNPQLLKIVNNHLDDFIQYSDNQEQIVQDLSLLEEVRNLLEVELSYLSNLEKEIIYWLAICCNPISLKQLTHNISQSQRKLEFLQSLNCLEKRSLIQKQDAKYLLIPLMKAYLRRKLVQQALNSNVD